MEDKKFDSVIQEAVYKRTEHLHAPSCLIQRIHSEINSQSKEADTMKKIGWKKVAVTAVVICTFCTIIAAAAGRVTGLRTGSNPTDNAYPAFSDVNKAESKLGYNIQAVDKFSNGFSYEQGNIRAVEGTDDAGNAVTSYNVMDISYKDGNGSRLNFNASRPTPEAGIEKRPALETADIGGITVSYYCDRYKFYPPEVSPSEEDLAEEAAGRLYISYGSSEIEEMYFCSASWTQDGTDYLMMISDISVESAQLFQMAKEVIEAK